MVRRVEIRSILNSAKPCADSVMLSSFVALDYRCICYVLQTNHVPFIAIDVTVYYWCELYPIVLIFCSFYEHQGF